jgi:hypothetical protein
MNDVYSFYQLICKYQIEIPIIQRDYAQGRDNAKAADVRKYLVENMIKAVKEDKPLFFDFVYGRVDDGKFIPFDGQQRLTTLFLFHKYVFEKCQSESNCQHKCNCICNTILSRFTYATRQSSREFCEKLVQENIIPSNGIKISENIMNLSWFYPYWQKDPTVMSMLTMFDEIHSQMKDLGDFNRIAEKLTSGCNCPITFHFVDMGEHKLSDETYVKMNARGKQLTPFENFKASLEQYLEENHEQELQKKLKEGIDGNWLDLFWNVVNDDKTEKVLPDTLMMSFFNRHFMNVWRCWYANTNKSNELDAFNDRIQKEMPLYPTKDDFVSFEIYSFVMDECGVDNCLKPIFNICDVLSTKDNNINNDCQAVWSRDEETPKWNLYHGDKNNNNRETYPSRIAFYALMMLFYKDSAGTTSLAQWMRVVWNIIENSTIDSDDTYQSALKLIKLLSSRSNDIYNALANDFDSFELGDRYHAQEQVKEEIAKAKQILNGSPRHDGECWENTIIKAEKYAFFKGAIRFLFQNPMGGTEGEADWSNFNIKWENANKYFDEGGVKDGEENYKSNSLLMKSLLANGDWCNIWWHFEFSNDANHWKRILTSNKWKNAVDAIMIDITTDTNIIKNYWIKNIVDDGLMDYVCKEMPGAWIRSTYHGYHAIWKSGCPASQVVLNPILAQLNIDKKIKYCSDNRIENCRYYKCKDRNVNPNEIELEVYLMEEEWRDYKKRKEPKDPDLTDKENYYCFSVDDDEKENTDSFIRKLDNLIEEVKENGCL